MVFGKPDIRQEEIEEVIIETDNEGVIVKADSLGSLEALIGLLKENDILIKRASIGDINKSDISIASAEENNLFKVILGFNVRLKEETKEVKIINKKIIYQIVDEYKEWESSERRKEEAKQIESLQRPFRLTVLPGTVFRQSHPAVVGVEIINGILKIDSKIMNELGFLMRGEIIWDKGSSSGGSCAWGSWKSASNPTLRDSHEYILVFSKGTFQRIKDTEKIDTLTRDDFLELTKSIWKFNTESDRPKSRKLFCNY